MPTSQPPATTAEPADSGHVAWVCAAQGGDRQAFARLHARFAKTVRGVLMARHGVAELDDLEQEVFALALEHLGQLRRPHAFGPWLLQIARRVAGHARARPQHEALVVDVPVRDGPKAEAQWVLEQIRQLPECYSEPLILRLVFGMSGPEIARQLGYAPGSIRVNLHRGMTKLRAAIEGTS